MIEKDERVRASIMEAATKVFQRWGLHKTTMEDIARAAGKGKSTLYYYFKSKEEIFHTIANEEITNITRLAEISMGKVVSAKEKLRVYTTTVFKEIHDRTMIYSILVGEVRINNQLIEQIQQNFNKTEAKLVQNLLTLGIEAGEFRKLSTENIAKTATLLVTIIRSFEIDLILDNRIQDIDSYINLLNGIIIDGIKE